MSGCAAGTKLLFVYGTLMKGLGEDWQDKVGARLIGHGRISAKLYDLGDYPGAVTSEDARRHVEGEVYQLDDPDLATKILDQHEEFFPPDIGKSLFVRKELPVAMRDGTQKRAWVYLYNRPVNETDSIPSGNYRERTSARR
jgi:gamma-glutamylcyclotransferase (GGCT)/AIG2-like uncharacterized protein YtfP